MPVGTSGSAGTLAPEILGRAVEACPCGIVVVDGRGIIVLANGEIERLFGYRRDELLGRPIEMLLPESLRGKHAVHRRDFSSHPQLRHLGAGRDFNGRHKNGNEFPVEIGLNPIRVGDELTVVGSIVDISERKRMERMQDEFVATVSHELRTPMTSIAASLGLLLAGTADNLPQPAAHLLKIAHTNCQRLVRMVNDILDLKKLDSGEMLFHFQHSDACSLLDKAIEANRGLADSRGVGVRLEAIPDTITLNVDPDRFVQLITNLLSNAIKFSSPGENVSVALGKRGANARIAVRDHGPGIPAEFKPRVFDAFAQAATGRQLGGTGLGLSIARQIVMRMDGQIGFEDAPGGGTVFYIELPDADQVSRRQRIASAS
jgi:PAS domain S-box-containing protein